MKITSKLNLIAFTGILAACGLQNNATDKKDKTGSTGNGQNQQDPDSSTDGDNVTSAELAVDSDTTADIITAQVDEAISAAADSAESGSGSASGPALTEVVAELKDGENEASDPGVKLKRTRTCVASDVDGTAVVTIASKFSGSTSEEIGRWSFSHAWNRDTTETRTWSKEGDKIGCSADARFAAVPLKDMAGVNLKVALEGSRTNDSTRTAKIRGTSATRSMSVTIKGAREFNVDSVSRGSEEEYLINKTVTSSVQRAFKLKRFNGDEKNFSISVATLAGAPLKITVERDSLKLGWVSRTLNSGTISTSLKGGGTVEASFENVRYEKRAAKLVCDAVSGQISGVVRDADGKEISTYKIVFGEGDRTISFSDGKSVDYLGSDCDLSGE
jgi:hypothetical protein